MAARLETPPRAPLPPRIRTTCPYCGVGCGLEVSLGLEAGRAVEIAGDARHPANFGRLCSKGAALAETLGLEGRLLYPEIHGHRTSWDEALDVVASRFVDCISRFGPDSVAFYVSGQLLTEDYYVANKLMKGFIGRANIDTNSRLCMASAVAGHQRALGEDVVPGCYEDIDCADLIVLVGSNAAWCHPVLFQRILAAKAARPGVRIVVIDPRRTATAEAADLHLALEPGCDALLFNGLLNYLRREDALDWDFLESHTEGFAAAMAAAKPSGGIPAVARACGLNDAAVAEFFRWFAGTERTVTLFSQGVNQSTSGTDKVNAIINVHLATGRIGKRGSGPFSLTGQPNAMGGREVGALATQLAAHMGFSTDDVARAERFWKAPCVARQPGLKAVEMFDAVAAGRIKAIWIMCTNPAVTMPDADRVERALRSCDFVVVSECTRETDTASCAHVLLPAAAWGEKSGTVTNSERRISRQRAFLAPPGETRPDWWIVTRVARRMGFAEAFPYESPHEIFREHAALSAFENGGARAFDIGALANLTAEGYDALEPVQWPLPARAANGGSSARVFCDGKFRTPSGKARLVAVHPRPPSRRPDETHPLVLNTGRVRDQWHTMTRTGASPRLSAHRPEPFISVHPDDARRAGLADGGLAEVAARGCTLVLRVEVTDTMRPGQIFVPMHWSRQNSARARVGALIPAETDPISGQPELKHAVAALRPVRPGWRAFVLSRARIDPGRFFYVARTRGAEHWRYELAGDGPPPPWRERLRDASPGDGEWIDFADPGTGSYRAAMIRGERLEVCVFMSAELALPPRAWLAGLFAAPRLDGAVRLALLSGRPPGSPRVDDTTVCSCFGVGRIRILEAIRRGGLASTQEIGRELKAGTSCGSCVPELTALLEQTLEGRS